MKKKEKKKKKKQIYTFFEDQFISLSLFHISLFIPCLRLHPEIRIYEYNIQNIPILAENIYLKRRILKSAIWVILSLGRMKVKYF